MYFKRYSTILTLHIADLAEVYSAEIIQGGDNSASHQPKLAKGQYITPLWTEPVCWGTHQKRTKEEAALKKELKSLFPQQYKYAAWIEKEWIRDSLRHEFKRWLKESDLHHR